MLMEYFLPIAEVYINLPLVFLLSLVVGVLSGLFGVGGGFLMTPFLIFMGVPPTYAVPNEANNILGTSISGSTTHWFKGTLDYKMGLMIVVGGAIGTAIGIVNFLVMLGGMLILPLVGFLLDYFWQGDMQLGVRHYTYFAFHNALLTIPVCLLLGALLSFTLDRTYRAK